MAENRFAAVERAASLWRDPDFPLRAEAVARTLELENRFTFESVTFALNQQLSQLSAKALKVWIGETQLLGATKIGVLGAGNVPFIELQDFLAVVLSGGDYHGALSSRSPFLLPAFVETICEEWLIKPRFYEGSSADKLRQTVRTVDALVATGSVETINLVRQLCDDNDVSNRLLRNPSFSVGILDGSETENEFEGLAEDALLHDGLGCRSVAIVFAPSNLAVDHLLKSANHFRAVFPAHERTRSELAMHIALLEATSLPCAYPEDKSFLISRGAPDVMGPGHIRWTTYDDIGEVDAWLQANSDRVQMAFASEGTDLQIQQVPRSSFGLAQRPELDWSPDGNSIISFLQTLKR